MTGRIGFQASPELARAIEASVKGPNHRLIIDLQGVDYMSSAGVSILREWSTRLRDSGGLLVVAGVCEPVRVVLELGGGLPGLVVEPTRAQAIARARR